MAKDGYRAEPAELSAAVTKGDQFQARFRLSPEPARLLLTGAVPALPSKSTAGAPAQSQRMDPSPQRFPPESHGIELTKEGFAPTAIRSAFGPGRTVQLGGAQTRMASAAPTGAAAPSGSTARTTTAPPTAAPAPDPAAVEAAEWQRLSRSATSAEVEEFLQKYPAGKNAPEAHRLLERLDWAGTNRSNRAALQAFLAKHPSGANAPKATAEIARLDREAAAGQQSQQEAERLRTEREQVRAVLRSYGDAYARKDDKQIQALWPSMAARNLRDIRASFRDFQSLKVDLQPLGEPQITGTTARVLCKRVTDAVDRNGSHPTEGTVTVQFEKRNGRWTIDSIQ